MALTLEKMRLECAQRIYKDTFGISGKIPWWNLKPEIQESYIRMASAVFDELFKLQMEELIDFFSDDQFFIWLEKNGYKKIN